MPPKKNRINKLRPDGRAYGYESGNSVWISSETRQSIDRIKDVMGYATVKNTIAMLVNDFVERAAFRRREDRIKKRSETR